MRGLMFFSAFLLCLMAGSALAQVDTDSNGNTIPQLQNPSDETIEIGLSTETVAITSNFGGTDLTIFGALDNADPAIQRQGRYDIIVVLQGPSRDLVVRKKDRYLGVWINADSETFMGVPLSYSLASTRNLQDIADEQIYRQLSVGVRNFYLAPEYPGSLSGNIATFGNELREIKIRQGLYSQRIGGVEFISRTLFRATLSLPANVPVGRHRPARFCSATAFSCGKPMPALKSSRPVWNRASMTPPTRTVSLRPFRGLSRRVHRLVRTDTIP